MMRYFLANCKEHPSSRGGTPDQRAWPAHDYAKVYRLRVVVAVVVVVVAGLALSLGIYICWAALFSHLSSITSTYFGSSNQMTTATTIAFSLPSTLLSSTTFRVPRLLQLDLSLLLAQSGKPPNPGPEHAIDILVQNVTSLATTIGDITNLVTDFAFLQEVSVPSNEIADNVQKIKTAGLKCQITGPDPEMKCTGGLAAIYKPHNKCIKLQPITAQFKNIYHNGRVQLLGLPTASGALCVVVNLYLWSGSSGNSELLDRTNNLLEVVFDELAQYPRSPWLILGDFNTDLEEVPILNDFLTRGEVFDIGSIPGIGDTSNTCFPTNSDKATRRDYVLCSPSMVQYVKCFEVLNLDFNVHRALHLQISFPRIIPNVNMQNRSMSFKVLLEQCAGDNDKLKISKEEFCAVLDISFAKVRDKLTRAYQNKNTSALWKLWTITVGTTMAQFLDSKGSKQGTGFYKIGKLNTKKRSLFQPATISTANGQAIETTVFNVIGKVSKQITRLRKLLSLLSKTRLSDDMLHQCQCSFKAIIDNMDCVQCEYDKVVLGCSFEHTPRFIVRIKLLLNVISKHLDQLIKDDKKKAKLDREQVYTSDRHLKASYRYITKKFSQTLSALKTFDGSITTSPLDLDDILRQAWSGVYLGNCQSAKQTIMQYLIKYGQFLYRREGSFIVSDISANDIRSVCEAYPLVPRGLIHGYLVTSLF